MENAHSGKYSFYVQTLNQYIALQKRYALLLKGLSAESAEIRKVEEAYLKDASNQFELKENAKKQARLAYVEGIRYSPDVLNAFWGDVRSAVADSDLILLDFLFDTSVDVSLAAPEMDLFILKWLVSFFRKNDDADICITTFSKLLFEKVLDVSDNDLEDYAGLILQIFTLGKQDTWYADFNSQIQKLLALSLKDKNTFEALLPGLNIDIPEIREDLLDFISYHYIGAGSVNEDLQWVEDRRRL